MQPTVLIAFDQLQGGQGNFFTLDDPVKGVLDTAPFGLAGDLIDVTDDVRAVTFRRGRSSETQVVDAGSATVELDNRLRWYDPLAPASVSPYAPSILPRKGIFLEIAGERLFSGQIEDWDLLYSPSGDSVTLAKASDGLTLLNQEVFASGAGATGLSGSVLYQAAASASWPLTRLSLDEGTASVGAHTIANDTNVLSYMQKISTAEQGLLFIDKDGNLAFRDRISPRRVMGTMFADDGTGIPFSNIEITYGTEFLFTEVTVESPSGKVTALSASANIADYGLTSYSIDTFLPDLASASVIAEYLAGRYGQPTLRITGVEVDMNSIPATQRAAILNLDLSHGVEVVFTPNKIGDPIRRELAVDSIEHNITPGSHRVRLGFYEPYLVSASGFVVGSESTAGSVTGFVGYFGTISGSVGTQGYVEGAEGNVGTITGSSGTAGTVVGVKATFFTLDVSLLDADPLG